MLASGLSGDMLPEPVRKPLGNPARKRKASFPDPDYPMYFVQDSSTLSNDTMPPGRDCKL